MGELLDPLLLEHSRDVAEVDRGRQTLHDASGFREVAGKGLPHGAVILEELQRLRRQRVDRVRADQRIHVQHIGVRRIFGARAGPQETLGLGSGGGNGAPPLPVQQVAEPRVGELRVRDRDFPAHGRRRTRRGVEPPVDLRIDATDEEGCDGREPIDRLPGAASGFERAQIGLSHLLIVLERKQEGDVDVDPVGQQALDRGPSFTRAWHLDHDVRTGHGGPQATGFRDRAGRVARERGRHLERDEPVSALRCVVDRAKRVRSSADVFHGEQVEDLTVGPGRSGDSGERLVVVGASADGVLEDRWVGCHAAQPVVDQPLELPGRQHPASQVVEPDALPEVEQCLHAGLRCDL